MEMKATRRGKPLVNNFFFKQKISEISSKKQGNSDADVPQIVDHANTLSAILGCIGTIAYPIVQWFHREFGVTPSVVLRSSRG